ncbi:MAG: outer membrane protein assembly factor BamC [Methylococcaceae bacterium]|nr:outer membrane protein assembly factor BamC [Methylococcaceae bacterium]MDP3904453.1 outer membrane protein assembly factor BamC [Methylococcaceae bacterium]
MKAKHFFYAAIGLMLAACSADNSKYRDIRNLERPPTLAITKQASEDRLIDDGALDKKPRKQGLGGLVSLTEDSPPKLKIKQPVDQAWESLRLALKQSSIEVTDFEQDKGLYYVAYKTGGFFSKLASGSLSVRSEANYTLTLEEDGDETIVTAKAIQHESTASSQDGYNETQPDASEELLQSVYDTLHDDLKPE